MDKPHSVAADPSALRNSNPASPTRSDRSSDSEGRPVRQKLKETRIDAQATSDPAPSSDQPMNDAAVNGAPGDASTSGSDNERGRLRRKRSREEVEDDVEEANAQGKKHERHVRKKSRDVTSPASSDVEVSRKKVNGTVGPIAEADADVARPSAPPTAVRQATPEATVSDKEGGAVVSPKNKRKLEDAAATNDMTAESSEATAKAATAEERDAKRHRDGASGVPVLNVAENKSKIPAGSGFSNTSSTSPFATVAPKSPVKPAEAPGKDLPQTSDQAFKSSGFGAFASSTASPFAAATKSGSSSPFGAAAGNKLSSFASKPAASSSTPSGFASLGGSSSFAGGSSSAKPAFGGSLGGSGFGHIIGGKPALSTFGGGGSITGLKGKSAPEFGAAEKKAASDDDGDEEGGDTQEGDEGDDESERRTSQPLLSTTGPPETGEENEDTLWSGRAKLYTLAGPAGQKSWQERGVGPLKLNATREEPVKTRFVLRADGTHRLLLNVAVTSHMSIGDASGNEPKDGKLLFTAPTATGEVESHILKVIKGPVPTPASAAKKKKMTDPSQLKPERASDLWHRLERVKKGDVYA